ncbi:MAG: hypothetical protein AB1600_08035, partial [Bacteroidota bacterium]
MKTLVLFMVLLVTASLAQVETRKPFTAYDIPEFYVDAISFSSGDSTSSRTDVYVQVPYDALQFVKKDNRYVAMYEVMINFLTEDNVSVSEKVWSEEIVVPNYSMTESKSAFSLTQRSLMLQPGIYKLRAQVRDNESKKAAHVVKRFIVGNYANGSLSISDLMLVSKVTSEGEGKKLQPNISGNIGEKNNLFYIFFEIYSPVPSDS